LECQEDLQDDVFESGRRENRCETHTYTKFSTLASANTSGYSPRRQHSAAWARALSPPMTVALRQRLMALKRGKHGMSKNMKETHALVLRDMVWSCQRIERI